jgi:excisionase family DNA binding protein
VINEPTLNVSAMSHTAPFVPLQQQLIEGDVEPLLVTVAQAQRLLGVCKTTIYSLITAKKLERRRLGRATRITMRSIQAVASAAE